MGEKVKTPKPLLEANEECLLIPDTKEVSVCYKSVPVFLWSE